MTRTTRTALLAGAALLVAATGTVMGMRPPANDPQPAQQTVDGEDEVPTADDLTHAADRLRDHQIDVDDAAFSDLANRFGVGGAVRVLAWASNPDDDVTIEIIAAMREGDGTEGSGMGWGQIARELGVHPGLGSIMGNGGGNGGDGEGNGRGHGRDNAPGQQGRTAP